MSLKVVFAGTPEFAAQSLVALHQAGYDIPLVLTQPDRPSGRGMQLRPSPVKEVAQQAGIPVAQPAGLRLDGKHAEDRKSTRLNSSHVAISYAVSRALPSSPTRRSSDLPNLPPNPWSHYIRLATIFPWS